MSPADHLDAETAALRALVRVLQQEQVLLADGDAESHARLLEDKAGHVAELSQLANDRHRALGSLGFPANEAGMPLSRSQLKSQPVVQQGQPVRLVAMGDGFSVSGEGRALTSGAEGDLVQARTASGQLVAGVAQADGVLSVRY